jgi:DNA-binding response OmpR family regulator
MKPRVLIFDENEAISATLKEILDERGYEVFTFPNSGLCPLFLSYDHKHISENACSDIIISDLYSPTIEGLKKIKVLIDDGCKVRCRALMSTNWSEFDWQYACKLGCRLFRKPFDLKEMLVWIDNCRQTIDPERKLFNLWRNKKN